MKVLIIALLLIIAGCSVQYDGEEGVTELEQLYDDKTLSVATFAGGCFWCMEPPYEKLEGVEAVISGYSGGLEENPTYKEVSSGSTGHVEAIQIHYDPKIISYEELLDVFWMNVDPTDNKGQFVDRGFQYTTAIFTHNEEQMRLAIKSKEQHEQENTFGEPIVTRIEPFTSFYPAEGYHQDYYKKNKVKYEFYRSRSGRDQYLTNIWG